MRESQEGMSTDGYDEDEIFSAQARTPICAP